MNAVTSSASAPCKDASRDALEDARKSPCEVCGKPCERKRRRNGSWFYYRWCRRCRRQSAGAKPAAASITDGRLLYLIELLYQHVWKLKEQSWEGAPKKLILQRLQSLVAVVKER